MAASYVPLRIFSSYSMLEGAIDPKAIAARAKALGLPAAALVDRNGLYAAMPFTEACFKAGVQPIIGALLGVARADRPELIDWLPLLAQDQVGYENLCALVSAAHLDRPIELDAHVPFAALTGRTDGLIALTGGAEGAVTRLLADGQRDAAEAMLAALQALGFLVLASRRMFWAMARSAEASTMTWQIPS